MKSFSLGSYALSGGVAVALLAGCGESQPPIAAPGAMPQSGITALPTPLAYSVLYDFGGVRGDGSSPEASMIDVRGTLYGTTAQGGAYKRGTVFSVTTSGTEKVLHSFGSGNDGGNPVASLVNVGGTLYGTTENGGAYTCGNLKCGTVFSITRSGTEKVLLSFSGSNGAFPVASLVNVGGTLYGTTEDGGAYKRGTVFSVTTSGTESVVYSFKGAPDGAFPAAGLVDVDGTLYGTTTLGGANCGSGFGCGTVFSITTGGSENVLHSFGNGTDGRLPTAGLVNVRGTLYGATSSGGRKGQDFGVLFSVSGSGTEKVLHSFNSGGHRRGGATNPNGLINVRGSLYGTASRRGQFGGGAVFVQTL
jgi:uncharacterized repeat protein (TIGR03803 family)